MTKSERMKANWEDPEFREKHKESLQTRRKRGEVKAEKAEKARRRAIIQEDRDIAKEARLERQRKKEVIQEYVASEMKEKGTKEVANMAWRTCMNCFKLVSMSKITNKKFTFCIDCD